MNLQNVTREEQIVGGLALLLAIFLFALPWFNFDFGVASTSFPATDAPDGWLGILAFLAALAIVVDLAIERFSPQTQIPAIGNSRSNTRFILAIAAAAFVALKFLFHIHFSGVVSFGWGFYVDVIVTGALVYFAMQMRTATASGGGGRPARPVATPAAGTTTGGTPPPSVEPGSGSVPPEGPGGSTPPPRV